MGSASKAAKTQKIFSQCEEGQYTRLMPRLKLDDPMAYQNFIRMPPELFPELKQRLTPELQRERTWMRESLSPGLKLAVTLRHLASIDSYPTLQYAFRVASPGQPSTSLCLTSAMLSSGPRVATEDQITRRSTG